MTQTDKRISAYTDQIIHYIDKLVEFIEPSQYEYNQEVVEDAVREIDDRLKFLKQKLIIEHGGMQLTTPPQKQTRGIPRVIMCVETGVVYDSIKQASEATGVNSGNISLVVRGINKTAGGYHWVAFEEDRDDDSPRPTTKRRPRRIPVLCVELMKEYPSAKAAEEDTGIDRNSISLVVNGKKETAGGYHWRKMPKYKPTKK